MDLCFTMMKLKILFAVGIDSIGLLKENSNEFLFELEIDFLNRGEQKAAQMELSTWTDCKNHAFT